MVEGWEGRSHTVCPFQLCCLHADMLGSLGPKEAKKAFLDFCHSFLDKTAVRDTFKPPIPTPWPWRASVHLLPPPTKAA